MTSRDTPDAKPSTGRQALLWILKIVISVGLLYVLFTRIDATDVWDRMRGASLPWIAVALSLYLVMILISTWRWQVLLRAQDVIARFGTLLNSYFAATFANNFLPSNIGGDVIRISDTARASGSKTLATAVVLVDRGVGVLALASVAACGATMAAGHSDLLSSTSLSLIWLGLLMALAACLFILARPDSFGALVRPLRIFHAEWVDRRIDTITRALHRFGRAPVPMLIGFAASIGVQTILVAFYAAVAAALHLAVPIEHLAILVPMSFIVQMLPLSMNGHGLREWTFVGYLARIGVENESATALSLVGAALVMLFSMLGAATYLARRHQAK